MPRETGVIGPRLIDLTAALAMLVVVIVILRLLTVANPTTIALVLLLVVLGAATISGMWVASAAAVAAVLAFNYFFLPPVGTFTIADPHNWVALVAFLVVAGIGSQLSAVAQARARDAVERRQEVSRLFDLSRDILLTTDIDSAMPSLARHIARRFELDAVAIAIPGDQAWSTFQGGTRDLVPTQAQLNETVARQRGMLEYDARTRTYGGHGTIVDSEGRAITLLPLRLGTRTVGILATYATVIDVGALDALGGVVAIAIERVNFLRERQTSEALRQRADLASALLAALGHDLRTPLTAVRLAVANLQRTDASDNERQAQSALALSELDRLNRVFQDILDMARIDAAAITAERDWVTPADVVDASVARLGSLLDARPLQIAASADALVEIDPRLTSNALAHLIENAAQYSSPGTPIEIDGEATAEGLRLSVRDHGPGLDPEELSRLFERFFRGRVSTQHTLGTGMGLAITRGLLAAEQGRVWGENADGGGARFSIVVPAAVRRVAGREA